MKGKFIEAIIAPGYEPEALELLKKKKNIRLLEVPRRPDRPAPGLDFKKVTGGVLVQTRGTRTLEKDDIKVVTERAPTEEELESLMFAWKVVRHVKSNSVVFVKGKSTVGVGAGQMNRMFAVKLAGAQAGERAKGAVMASDAFFPFRDGIDEAAKCGITAVIQPGGSIRDQESIAAANEHGMAMVFTGWRVFKH
jgi:phosphoribosylaminoimidazolecarboxamide formyltransferase/IMP cyclohydrolase